MRGLRVREPADAAHAILTPKLSHAVRPASRRSVETDDARSFVILDVNPAAKFFDGMPVMALTRDAVLVRIAARPRLGRISVLYYSKVRAEALSERSASASPSALAATVSCR